MIVVFDAECLLCCHSVRFLLAHDKKAALRFASIQSTAGSALVRRAGLLAEQVQSVLFWNGRHFYQNSEALFQILRHLGWPWRVACAGRIIPAAVRDACYLAIARNRYELFAHPVTCLVPDQSNKQRFLD